MSEEAKLNQEDEMPQAEQAAVSETADAGNHKVELKVIGGEDAESGTASSVKSVRFAPLNQMPAAGEQGSIDLLLDVDLALSVELGRAAIPVREVLQLGPGSIVELDKLAGEPVDIMVNGKLIARGEVVVVDENFGIRVTEIASQNERLSGLA
jgi:flagellar motor switch protein FliN